MDSWVLAIGFEADCWISGKLCKKEGFEGEEIFDIGLVDY